MKRYGVESVFQSEEVKEKIKETTLEKYGVEHTSQALEVSKKRKQTNLERYGVECVFEVEYVKEKSKQTCKERYGVEYASQSEELQEKRKQMCMEKYGVESPAKLPETKEKRKQTNLERYGVENLLQLKEFAEKRYETMKKNGSLGNKSKEENVLYDALVEKFGADDIDRQHKEDRYPFMCDFYIKSLDMFIEYNGFWTHNSHPYNPESKEDNEKVIEWKKIYEEKGHEQYKSAIHIWTERDPLKRQTAKENNLNFVELWNLKEALKFVETL